MKVLMDVLSHVQILYLVMSAPVDQAINWQVINMAVMVSSMCQTGGATSNSKAYAHTWHKSVF